MRAFTKVVAVGLVAVGVNSASAQVTAEDFAAWQAMMTTPIGSFAPMSAGPMKGQAMPGNAVAVRVSTYKMDGATESNNTIGGTYSMNAGSNARLNANVGYMMCGDDCGSIMLGADVISPLWAQPAAEGKTTAMSANLQGSIGYGMDQSPSEANSLSLAVGVPLGITMNQANNGHIAAFLTPGFGWGSVSASGTSTSGTRPFFGLGAEWMAPAGWALHVGIQKVMIEDGPTNVGAGFNWKLGS